MPGSLLKANGTVLFLVAFLSATACGQTRMSVADVDALVNDPHLSADALAGRLRSIELTERATPQRLERWQAALKDPKAHSALQAIADLSAFLALPPSDLPSAPAPDQATQQAILARATDYAANMRPRLPNFSALRATTRFEFASTEDMQEEERALQLQQLNRAKLAYSAISNLGRDRHIFQVGGISRSHVTYRDGSEISTPDPDQRHDAHLSDPGLTSSGEFGGILAIVDGDAAAATIAWDHWEQGPGKLLAVYRYAVPQDKSHFAVYSPSHLPGMGPNQVHPAYNGEIAVDPDNGSIYRIVVIDESDPPDPALLSGVAVEYAPTEIGGKTYVCPVHSIAVMTRREPIGNLKSGPPRRYVNDVAFTEYHLFRSDMRILP